MRLHHIAGLHHGGALSIFAHNTLTGALRFPMLLFVTALL
jgi:hypothetical protein